jgi:hypothetical protein
LFDAIFKSLEDAHKEALIFDNIKITEWSYKYICNSETDPSKNGWQIKRKVLTNFPFGTKWDYL